MIKASASKEIDALLADLSSDFPTRREAAIARLIVIGSRSVDRLIRLAANRSAPLTARVGAFRALEAIGDERVVDTAISSLAEGESVAGAAVGVLRALLKDSRALKTLDSVTSAALDRNLATPARVAAIQALSDLPPSALKPIAAALKREPDPEIANVLLPSRSRAPLSAAERLRIAADGRLPDEAAALREAIARAGAGAPAAILQQIVDRIRIREGGEAAEHRPEWMAARAAAHLALAKRRSRVALYDLRETMETTRRPIQAEFLTALSAIGDASCLEPLAGAYARTTNGNGAWLRVVANTFRTIANREKITRRSAVMKKIEKRWPGTIQSIVDSR